MQQLLTLESILPCSNAARSIASLSQYISMGDSGIKGLDTNTLEESLGAFNDNLRRGSMHHVESMLLDQAHTLQAMSTHFISRLAKAEYLSQIETYARIALKAQNQCRQTIATLGELKNPRRTTFVKQQNNAVNQQINQVGLKQPKNSKIPDNSANKLLNEVEHERMDIGAPQEAVGGNQQVETVGEVNWSKNNGRKG